MESLEDLVSGEDELSTVGAMAPITRGGGQLSSYHGRPASPSAAKRWMRTVSAQGVSTPQEELDYLPFETTILTPTVGQGSATAFPQRPFRGERLIATATYVPATGSPFDASGIVAISPAIYVGSVQVGASQGQAPLSTFAANAFGVRLSFPSSGQGSRIFIPYFSGAPIATGDMIIVSMTVIGKSVR